MTISQRAFLAKYLAGAADYHEQAGSHVEVDDATLRALRRLGCEIEPPIDTRKPGRMYPATARRYAAQLTAKDQETDA